MAVKKGLGKGLDALISSVDEAAPAELEIDINLIEPNRSQPRTDFDPDELAELAESIRSVGVISPIVVRKEEDYYSIVAGERRWRAARLAGLRTLPVAVRTYSDSETLAVALIENLQRVDLNPMEEAVSYKRLSDEFGFTQEEIAEKIGKSRSAVANILRYLGLTAKVREMLRSGEISQGHAKVLLGVEDAAMQEFYAGRVASAQISVRALEDLVKALGASGEPKLQTKKKPAAREPLYRGLELELDGVLGTKTNIKTAKNGAKGRIEIEFYSKDELDRIFLMLKNIRE